MLSRSFLPTVALITPGADVMLVPGFAQFGWLKTLNALNSGRSLRRSCKVMYLATEICRTAEPGPMITPFADVPYEPRAGGVKAAASNQRFSERWSVGRFRLRRMFG